MCLRLSLIRLFSVQVSLGLQLEAIYGRLIFPKSQVSWIVIMVSHVVVQNTSTTLSLPYSAKQSQFCNSARLSIQVPRCDRHSSRARYIVYSNGVGHYELVNHDKLHNAY